ncbi:MAG: molybdenum ABC transporter permease [Chitinophagaceae bacterium]
MEALLVVGIVALVLGIALLYWINRRKFYRRNAFGSEGFSSYEKSVAITFIERVGKWIAYALIIIGSLFLWAHSRQQKESAKKKQLVKLGAKDLLEIVTKKTKMDTCRISKNWMA